MNFLQSLFDVFPLASEDTEAQRAIRSTISRILKALEERETSPSILKFFASKLDMIEDELFQHPSNGGE